MHSTKPQVSCTSWSNVLQIFHLSTADLKIGVTTSFVMLMRRYPTAQFHSTQINENVKKTVH